MQLLWLLVLVCAIHGTPIPPQPPSSCPSDCDCSTVNYGTVTYCTTLDFVQNTELETLNKVSHLDIRHANLTKIGAIRKLKGLKSLQAAYNDIRSLGDFSNLGRLSLLNLRGNKLKTLHVRHLPKNLEVLDVSANHLSHFPDFGIVDTHDKLEKKHVLKQVNLAENPFVCSCELKAKCEELQKSVIMAKPVTCRRESGNHERVTDLKCSINSGGISKHNDLEMMQNDQVEGSGDEPEPTPEELTSAEDTDVFAEQKVHTHKLEDMRNENLLLTVTSSNSSDLTDDDYEDNEDEGSGHSGDEPEETDDEGSGAGVLILPTTEETPLKSCNFNCTPLTSDDPDSTNKTLPDPNLFDEVGKVFTDIFSSGEEEEEEVEESEEATETPMIITKVHKIDEGKSDAVIPVAINEEDKIHSANDSEASEVKEAGSAFGLSNNMIVVIALIIVMACIIIYTILIKRRKTRRHQRRPSVDGPAQEMKPMKPVKPARTSPPSDKNKNLPEKVPLINGAKNGGAKNGSGPTHDVTTPLINEPQAQKIEEPVQMRSTSGDHSPLLPETQRVTIQVKELTAPKTPLLVTRMKSTDGQIITTPEADQRH